MKNRFGVIGCSRVSQKVIPAIKESQELVMIGSRSSEKAALWGGQWNCAHGIYENVLSNKDIDTVYISLPNSLHEEWTIKAAEAGKHILCEKPAALSLESAKRMVAVAHKHSVRLMEGFMFRYHPQHERVQEILREGVLGNLLNFTGVFSYPDPPIMSNRMNSLLGGGAFNDSLPYPIYASRMIFGEPDTIFCEEFDDRISVLANYGIRTAFMYSAFGAYFQSMYSILGSRGKLTVPRAYAVPDDMPTKIILDIEDTIQEITIEAANHFKRMIDDFSQEILKGEKDFEDDLIRQARVLEACRISVKEKRSVRISELN